MEKHSKNPRLCDSPSSGVLCRCRSSIPDYGGNFKKRNRKSFIGNQSLRTDSPNSVYSSSTLCTNTVRWPGKVRVSKTDEDDPGHCHVAPTDYPPCILDNSYMPAGEACKLWDLIARFIERRLESRKGVILPGLGIMTLSSRKLILTQGLVEHSLKPVFIVSGKFAIYHRQPISPQRTSSDIPNMSLNFLTLSRILAVARYRVEMAYHETVEKINCGLRSGKKIIVPFRGIGHLVLSLETVKMSFNPEFLTRLVTTKMIRVSEHGNPCSNSHSKSKSLIKCSR